MVDRIPSRASLICAIGLLGGGPAGYELNYFRRQAMSEEEREDPEVMAEYFRDADVNFPDR